MQPVTGSLLVNHATTYILNSTSGLSQSWATHNLTTASSNVSSQSSQPANRRNGRCLTSRTSPSPDKRIENSSSVSSYRTTRLSYHVANETDTDAVTTVLTQNGALLLGDHEIRLLYSRRANDRIVARIVAEKEGVVVTKIEPSDDGKDQVEAFMALRRDIEVRLDRILSMVPGEVHAPVPSSPASAREGPSVRRAPVERPIPNLPESSRQQEGFGSGAAPPPYGSAVKEWRNDEKKG